MFSISLFSEFRWLLPSFSSKIVSLFSITKSLESLCEDRVNHIGRVKPFQELFSNG